MPPSTRTENPLHPVHAPCEDVALVTIETYREPRELDSRRPASADRVASLHRVAASPFRRFRLHRIDFVAAAVIFLAALAFRAPLILRGETLLHSDEAIVGLMAQDIAEGTRFPLYFYGQRYMGALEAYVVAAFLPLFAKPIHALRAAPAVFFAAMVGVQYLMLTRWLGRRAGLVGAAVLLCGPPMFAQWTISARGAYVENLLWGTLLLWAYAEWFACPTAGSNHAPQRMTPDAIKALRGRETRRQFIFGALVGSGLWLNPSIVFFLAPILVHYLLGSPLRMLRHATSRAAAWRVIDRLGVTALTVVVAALLLMVTTAWSVQVDESGVKSALLLGLLPRPVAAGVLAVAGVIAAWRLRMASRVRAMIPRCGGMLLGAVIGSAPAIAYILLATVRGQGLEPTLPLGLRPPWAMGDTLVYLLYGAPVFFGADPQPFLRLVTVGQDAALAPLDIAWGGLVGGGNWIVAGAAMTAGAVLLLTSGPRLGRLLRMEPSVHRPVALLALGALGCVGLYLFGGCSFNFTTIRYWLPIWVFLPGILACVFINHRLPLAGRSSVATLCAAWLVGQAALHQQVGAPHPMQRVADSLVEQGVKQVWAEPLDAHVLAYLTGQRCRVGEYRAFWARLDHLFQPNSALEGPTRYLVRPDEPDLEWDWIHGGFPGWSPPETKRKLWPDLRRRVALKPSEVVTAQSLPDGYHLCTLARPLASR